MAIINGNNLKTTKYWLKTEISINDEDHSYINEGVTYINGVEIEKIGEKIKIKGRNIDLSSITYNGYKKLKGKAIDFRVDGWVGNISTSTKKYVFDHIKPNKQITDILEIIHGIKKLEMHISDVQGNSHIEIFNGIDKAEMIGEGNTFEREEITNDSNKISITKNNWWFSSREFTIEGNRINFRNPRGGSGLVNAFNNV
uniref:Uncharacterized protein n=1 Tax=Meloidogyne enterolobii TaxID=390850 RepID=A0A6V7VV32_MELEN|nr:unnamed protein product [Meloidogyne enterolobii]